MHALYEQKMNQYWSDRIAAHSGNSKKLWQVSQTQIFNCMSSVLSRDRSGVQASPDITANKLAKFFIEKVERVRADTDNASPPSYSYTRYDGPQLLDFRQVSKEEVRRVLMHSPVKSCALDPLPTFILREAVSYVLPFIWVLINASL